MGWAILWLLLVIVIVTAMTAPLGDRPAFATRPIRTGMLVGLGYFCALSTCMPVFAIAASIGWDWVAFLIWEVGVAFGMSASIGLAVFLALRRRQAMAQGSTQEAGGGGATGGGRLQLPLWFEVASRLMPPVLFGVIVLMAYYLSAGEFFDWSVNGILVVFALVDMGLGVVALPALESVGPLPRRVRQAAIAIKLFTLWVGGTVLLLEAVAWVRVTLAIPGPIGPPSLFATLFTFVAGGAALPVLIAGALLARAYWPRRGAARRQTRCPPEEGPW
jgi:hypothetical protein